MQVSTSQSGSYAQLDEYIGHGDHIGTLMLSISLFAWYLTVAIEVNNTFKSMRLLSALTVGSSTRTLQEDDKFHLLHVTWLRQMFGFTVGAARLVIAALMMAYGAFFLIYDISIDNLIMNAGPRCLPATPAWSGAGIAAPAKGASAQPCRPPHHSMASLFLDLRPPPASLPPSLTPSPPRSLPRLSRQSRSSSCSLSTNSSTTRAPPCASAICLASSPPSPSRDASGKAWTSRPASRWCSCPSR